MGQVDRRKELLFTIMRHQCVLCANAIETGDDRAIAKALGRLCGAMEVIGEKSMVSALIVHQGVDEARGEISFKLINL